VDTWIGHSFTRLKQIIDPEQHEDWPLPQGGDAFAAKMPSGSHPPYRPLVAAVERGVLEILWQILT
jgi:hypothetical protein